MSIITDDRSIEEIGTRVSILIVVLAAAMCATATADVVPEPVRGPPPPPQPAKVIKTGYKVTEIAKGLRSSVVDGVFARWFDVGHRACRSVAPDSRRSVAGLQPIAGVPAVHTGSQAGLFDIVLHPNFAQNHVVYLTYAAGTKAANGTQVARARFDGGALQDLQVIFKAMPLKDTDNHYGGRMAFLPDGTFALTIGEGFEYREKAQDLTSDLGQDRPPERRRQRAAGQSIRRTSVRPSGNLYLGPSQSAGLDLRCPKRTAVRNGARSARGR